MKFIYKYVPFSSLRWPNTYCQYITLMPSILLLSTSHPICFASPVHYIFVHSYQHTRFPVTSILLHQLVCQLIYPYFNMSYLIKSPKNQQSCPWFISHDSYCIPNPFLCFKNTAGANGFVNISATFSCVDIYTGSIWPHDTCSRA